MEVGLREKLVGHCVVQVDCHVFCMTWFCWSTSDLTGMFRDGGKAGWQFCGCDWNVPMLVIVSAPPPPPCFPFGHSKTVKLGDGDGVGMGTRVAIEAQGWVGSVKRGQRIWIHRAVAWVAATRGHASASQCQGKRRIKARKTMARPMHVLDGEDGSSRVSPATGLTHKRMHASLDAQVCASLWCAAPWGHFASISIPRCL